MDLLKVIASIFLLLESFHLTRASQLEEKTTYYPTYAHQVIDILKKEVENKYRVHCYGRGGSMPTDVRSISVDFQARGDATIEASRKLFVNIYEDFKSIINEHEDIRPFLRECPFPNQRIELGLSYASAAKQTDFQGDIEYVSCINGIIRYRKRDPNSGKFMIAYQETYEEALRIVNGEK